MLVGHRTLTEGDRLRTGVTAILPHGENLYEQKVLGAYHAVNAYGKAAGLTQLAELGTIESPILLTNTLAVGAVWEGGLRHVLDQNPGAARDRDTVNVIVGECFDGWLSDARALAVRPDHALEAIAGARPDETGEGAVGAGTGTTCFGFKAGAGTSSRAVGGHTLGCLVVSNYGSRSDLHLLVGQDVERARPGPGGAGAGRLDHDRAGHRRSAVGAPAASAGFTRDVRPGARGQLRGQCERRVRDRVLHRSPGRAPGGARHGRLHASCATTRPPFATSSRPRARWCWSRS